MKIKVKVGETVYDVEVGDLTARPIIATVDGETFEIFPEAGDALHLSTPIKPLHHAPVNPLGQIAQDQKIAAPITEKTEESASATAQAVRAPLPGVIVAIQVHPEAEVVVGQELCKLEAMKMNNSIRASRAGRIKKIHVSVGQTVRHNELLMEYE